MNNTLILKLLNRLFDSSVTPGQAFDALVEARRSGLSYQDVVNACNSQAPKKLEEVDLATIPIAYTDDTPMPFGKYQGKPLRDVPASYLHWLWVNTHPNSDPAMRAYIKENMHVLKAEYPDGIWT